MYKWFHCRALGLVYACIITGSTSLPAADLQSYHHRPHHDEAWARTELYFGSDKHDGTRVSETEFMEFVDREITPRFPDGLTLVTGYSQFLDSEGVIEREQSKVLILIYPRTTSSAGKKIQEIREAYKCLFRQESVLRVDSLSKVSF